MIMAKNPANSLKPDISARKRIPMSVPTGRMSVPELPGYHLYWFLESRVPRAEQGGYEFVSTDEIPVTQRGVGTDSTITGNTDLGTKVRLWAGVGVDGKPEYQYLMKIKQEWFDEDQKKDDDRDAQMLTGIFRDEQILGSEKIAAEDKGTSYVKKALFQRPTRRGT